MERKERTISTIIIILILCFTFFNNVSGEKKYDFIVDKNGSGNFATIGEAVEHASEGSTIYVKSGEYPEIIDIRKNIRLIGEDKKTTIINPISNKNKYAVRLGAPGITLDDFSVTNGAPGPYSSGIRVAADKTQITNCKIYSNPVGIAMWTSENLIDNCIFYDCSDEGIAFLGSKHSKCSNNKISNCLFYENCDGIELQYSSGNIIENCEFYDNSHSGIEAIVSSNDNNIISNCKIQNNKAHGIYLSDSDNNRISNCIISDNEDGNVVEVKNSENNEIQFSSLENKKIEIERSSDNISENDSFVMKMILKFFELLNLANS